jgi:hypothetical protein
MYYRYFKSLGKVEIAKDFIVDDDIFSSKYAFLFKEILSDHDIKPCKELFGGESAIIIARSEGFIKDNIKKLNHYKTVKVVILESNKTHHLSNDYETFIDETCIPNSLNEAREKIILQDKTLKVSASIYTKFFTYIYRMPFFPRRIKERFKSLFGVSFEDLEMFLSPKEIFSEFSNVLDENNCLPVRLLELCWLSGISVNSRKMDREFVESTILKKISFLETELFK